MFRGLIELDNVNLGLLKSIISTYGLKDDQLSNKITKSDGSILLSAEEIEAILDLVGIDQKYIPLRELLSKELLRIRG